jgi:hypothetical protein
MVQMNELRLVVSALCLVATIGSAFACTVPSGGFRFLVFQSESGAGNIDLGTTYLEEPKTFKVTVENKDADGTFKVVYYLAISGSKSFSSNDLILKWRDTDGSSFNIGKCGDQTFSGTGTLGWNSAPTCFQARHKNTVTLTITFLHTAPNGHYSGKMWVEFVEKPIEAQVTITPKVLDTKSEGQWVTAYIFLPEPYKEKNIDKASVKLWYRNALVQAEPGTVTGHFLTVKFPRKEVVAMLGPKTGIVQLTVTGLVDSVQFSGKDDIFVLHMFSAKHF